MVVRDSSLNQVLVASVFVLCFFNAQAQETVPPVNLPDQLTPGGMLPQIEDIEPLREDPVYFSIPPLSERERDAENSERFRVESFDLYIDPVLRRSASAELSLRAQNSLLDAVLKQPLRGYSIVELEGVAADVTDIFRQAGFILALAYVPYQKVKNGVVRINVLPGTLSTVSVEGNKIYSTDRIARQFDGLVGEAVQVYDLQNAMLRVRDYPGMAPTAVLSPGSEVGETALAVRVAEQAFNFSVSGDNYGTVVNGEYRAIGTVVWNNPAGLGDRLRVDLLQTFNPAENTYGSVFYESPIAGNSWFMGATIYTNAFEVASLGQDLGLDGDSSVAGLFVRKQFVRSRGFNLDVDGALNLKNASFDSPFTTSGEREDSLSVLTIGLNFDTVDNLVGRTGVTDFRVWFDLGIADFLGSMNADGDCNSTRQGAGVVLCNGVSGFQYAGGDFTKLGFSFQRLQQLTTYNSLLIRGYYQVSNDLLVSLEQVSLGGAFNNRGYPVSQVLLDTGGYLTFEWIYNFAGRYPNVDWSGNYSLWNWILFADFGSGRKNEPFPGVDGKANLSSIGGGLEMGWEVGERSSVGFRFEVAAPVGSTEPLAIDDDDPRIWARLSYSF